MAVIGTAYAVLNSEGKLIFFRSNESYSTGYVGDVVDIMGNHYNGKVYSNFENIVGSDDTEPLWENDKNSIYQVITLKDQVIKPLNMAKWFRNCTLLNSDDSGEFTNIFTYFDTSQCKYMTRLFENCSSLNRLDLSSWKTFYDETGVQTVAAYYMFKDCTNLTTIFTAPATTWETISGADMFLNCNKIKGENGTVYNSSKLSSTYARIDKYLGSPGYFTSRTRGYAILENNQRLVFCRSPYDYTSSQQGTTTSTFEDIDGKIWNGQLYHSIEFEAFWEETDVPWYTYRSNIQEVVFLHDIHPAYIANWFANCENLVKIVNLSNLDSSSIMDGTQTFKNCSKLTEVRWVNFNPINWSGFTSMFEECTLLKSIDFVTNADYPMTAAMLLDKMFKNCSSLKQIDLSSINWFDASFIIDMTEMFYGCSSLEYLDMGNISSEMQPAEDDMFAGCSNLRTIVLSPHFFFYAESWGEDWGCVLPDLPSTDLYGGKWIKTRNFDGSISTDNTLYTSQELRLAYAGAADPENDMSGTYQAYQYKFIDFHKGGDGIGIGTPAIAPGVDINMDVKLRKGATANGEISSIEQLENSTTRTHNLTDKLDADDYLGGLTWDTLAARFTWDDLEGNATSEEDTHTTNLNLLKPSRLSTTAVNDNMDILDEKIGAVGSTDLQTQIDAIKIVDGNGVELKLVQKVDSSGAYFDIMKNGSSFGYFRFTTY